MIAKGLDPKEERAALGSVPTLNSFYHDYYALHIKLRKKLENDRANFKSTIFP